MREDTLLEYPYNCPTCGLPLEAEAECEVHGLRGCLMHIDDAALKQDCYLAQQVLRRSILRPRVWQVLDAGLVEACRERLGAERRVLQSTVELYAWVARVHVIGYVEVKLIDGVTGQEIYPLTSRSLETLTTYPNADWVAHSGTAGIYDRLIVRRLGDTLINSGRFTSVFERAVNAIDLQR
jgi:hypothetical protein